MVKHTTKPVPRQANDKPVQANDKPVPRQANDKPIIKQPENVQVPPPASKPSMIAEVGQNMLQGFSFGTGSALAHRAISAIFDASAVFGNKDASAVFGNKDASAVFDSQDNKKNCQALLESFQKCAQNNDYDTCKHIFQEFKECSL